MNVVEIRIENGKHIVTNNGREIHFHTLRIALLYVKLVMEGAFEREGLKK